MFHPPSPRRSDLQTRRADHQPAGEPRVSGATSTAAGPMTLALPQQAAQRQQIARLRNAGPSPAVVQRALIDVTEDGPQLDTSEPGLVGIKAYVKTLIDEHRSSELRALYAKIEAVDADKIAILETYREARTRELNTPLSQADDATRLGTAIDSPVGQQDVHAIPKAIHRFWSGGPMTESSMGTLLESADKTDGKGWQHTLWYSRNFEDSIALQQPMTTILGKSFATPFGAEKTAYDRDQARIRLREEQRQTLRDRGYQVRSIEELIPEDGASSSGVTQAELARGSQLAANSVKRGAGYDDLKFFSDLARLMYLHAEGGLHMDVDIGLGDMDLDQTYHHNDDAGQVPLMGTLARDHSDAGGGPLVSEKLALIRQHRDGPYGSGVSEEEYQAAVATLGERAVAGAGMYNALIASRPGTAHLQAAVDGMAAHLRKPQPALVSGMTVNPELLGGQRDQADFGAKRNAGLAQSVPPYLLRLQHLTDDSDL